MRNKSVGKGLSISRVLRLSSLVGKVYPIPSFFIAALNSEDIEVVANPAVPPPASKFHGPFQRVCGGVAAAVWYFALSRGRRGLVPARRLGLGIDSIHIYRNTFLREEGRFWGLSDSFGSASV